MSPFLTPSIPNRQKAIKIQGPGKASVVENSPVPAVRADEVLVQVICVALNPVDWKSADLSPTPGATWGTDFSGNVVAVGNATSRISVGDAVCGAAFGNNPDDPSEGAFTEYVAIPEELTFKVPKGMSFEQAATMSTGIATAGLTLYHNLGLPWPLQPAVSPNYVLVFGGSTASGAIMIQMLRLSGLIPIATCSPASMKRVEQLGAEKAFDYRSPNCGSEIREYTQDSLAYAVDCISESDSMKICYDSICSAGGRYVALDPFPIRGHTRRAVKPSWIIALTIYGCPINWKRPFKRDARPQDRQFARDFYLVAQELLNQGLLKAPPLREEKGGLTGVIEGAQLGREGNISGVKLVYHA